MIQKWSVLALLIGIGFGTAGVLADESSLPDLVGNWTGTSDGFHAGAGYFHDGDYRYVLNIGQQEGRIFNGTFIVSGLDPTREYPFSGVIAHDMKSLEMPNSVPGWIPGICCHLMRWNLSC